MPAESAILAHDPGLAPLIVQALIGADKVHEGPENQAVVQRSFQIAEASALVSLCEETLWDDYQLLPALRDDFLGDELGKLGGKVLRADGRVLRDIRERALREIQEIRKSETLMTGFTAASEDDHSGEGFDRKVNARYLAALSQWIAPQAVPQPLKDRIASGWYSRFCVALRKELGAHGRFTEVVRETDVAASDRRFDELNRQSWRLDEVLEKLDKWAMANPAGVRGGTGSATRRPGLTEMRPGGIRRWVLAVLAVVICGLVLTAAFWVAFSTSPTVQSLVAQVQVNRLSGTSERVARTVAWMGSEPVPREVFVKDIAILHDERDIADQIRPEQVDAALVDLQKKRLCHAVADGWVFHEQLRDKYREGGNSGASEWWERALRMVQANVPDAADSGSIESVAQWRLLLPHLIALAESAPDEVIAGEQMQSLTAILSKGLLAIRVEPGRRPALWDSPEPDALKKRINGFLEKPGKYFETEFKNIEQKHGRFSHAMVTAHRYLAETSWRNGQLKEEQNSWIRAARALERLEPRDADQIAFCNQRLGISRAIMGDVEGAEEAFAEGLKIVREHHGEAHPATGRMERKIARVFTDLGAFDPGWKHHQQAMEALIKAFPVPSPEIAELLEEQGELLVDYRQFKKGIELLKRGIQVWQQIEYATNSRIARAQGGLANVELLAGELAEAEQNARSQRDLLVKEFGVSSAEVRQADVVLSQILLAANDPAKAAKAAEAGKLMEPYAASSPGGKLSDTHQTALGRCMYARALVQTNQTKEAAAHFDRGIRVLLKTQPRPSLVVAECLSDYGRALLDNDRKLDGLKALEDAEAELNALTRMRPRYLRIATVKTDEVRELIRKARQ